MDELAEGEIQNGEIQMFAATAMLFQYIGGQWKLQGKGGGKGVLWQTVDTLGVRFEFCNSDGQILAAHPVGRNHDLKPHPQSDKAICWNVQEGGPESLKHLALKLADATTRGEFAQKFQKAATSSESGGADPVSILISPSSCAATSPAPQTPGSALRDDDLGSGGSSDNALDVLQQQMQKFADVLKTSDEHCNRWQQEVLATVEQAKISQGKVELKVQEVQQRQKEADAKLSDAQKYMQNQFQRIQAQAKKDLEKAEKRVEEVEERSKRQLQHVQEKAKKDLKKAESRSERQVQRAQEGAKKDLEEAEKRSEEAEGRNEDRIKQVQDQVDRLQELQQKSKSSIGELQKLAAQPLHEQELANARMLQAVQQREMKIQGLLQSAEAKLQQDQQLAEGRLKQEQEQLEAKYQLMEQALQSQMQETTTQSERQHKHAQQQVETLETKLQRERDERASLTTELCREREERRSLETDNSAQWKALTDRVAALKETLEDKLSHLVILMDHAMETMDRHFDKWEVF